jgi:hypothetical protein
MKWLGIIKAKEKTPLLRRFKMHSYYFFDFPEPLQHEHVSEPPSSNWKYPLPEQY